MERLQTRVLSFNPRICKRCDVKNEQYNNNNQCFNPRICKRCDVKDPGKMVNDLGFQSTHL